MAVPKSVKKQIKEAQKLQEALNTDPEVTDPQAAQPVEPEQKPVEQKPDEKETPNLDNQDLSTSGEEPKKDQKPDWEAKYKGLQTRYNREVPELRGKLSTAEETAESMKKEIQELKDAVAAVQSQPEPAKQELVIDDKLIEQYGEGTVSMMQSIAQQSNADLAKQIVDLQQELASVKQGVTNVRETIVVNNERDFFTELEREVKAATGKSWEKINEDHDFHNFLAEQVPYTGKERQEFLSSARKNLDVKAAAKFFIDYAGPSSKNEPEPETVSTVPEELITPEVSGGGIPPIEEAKVWTTGEIDQFYADKRKGKYKDPNEARKIEQDILAAGREGRIVNKRLTAYA